MAGKSGSDDYTATIVIDPGASIDSLRALNRQIKENEEAAVDMVKAVQKAVDQTAMHYGRLVTTIPLREPSREVFDPDQGEITIPGRLLGYQRISVDPGKARRQAEIKRRQQSNYQARLENTLFDLEKVGALNAPDAAGLRADAADVTDTARQQDILHRARFVRKKHTLGTQVEKLLSARSEYAKSISGRLPGLAEGYKEAFATSIEAPIKSAQVEFEQGNYATAIATLTRTEQQYNRTKKDLDSVIKEAVKAENEDLKERKKKSEEEKRKIKKEEDKAAKESEKKAKAAEDEERKRHSRSQRIAEDEERKKRNQEQKEEARLANRVKKRREDMLFDQQWRDYREADKEARRARRQAAADADRSVLSTSLGRAGTVSAIHTIGKGIYSAAEGLMSGSQLAIGTGVIDVLKGFASGYARMKSAEYVADQRRKKRRKGGGAGVGAGVSGVGGETLHDVVAETAPTAAAAAAASVAATEAQEAELHPTTRARLTYTAAKRKRPLTGLWREIVAGGYASSVSSATADAVSSTVKEELKLLGYTKLRPDVKRLGYKPVPDEIHHLPGFYYDQLDYSTYNPTIRRMRSPPRSTAIPGVPPQQPAGFLPAPGVGGMTKYPIVPYAGGGGAMVPMALGPGGTYVAGGPPIQPPPPPAGGGGGGGGLGGFFGGMMRGPIGGMLLGGLISGVLGLIKSAAQHGFKVTEEATDKASSMNQALGRVLLGSPIIANERAGLNLPTTRASSGFPGVVAPIPLPVSSAMHDEMTFKDMRQRLSNELSQSGVGMTSSEITSALSSLGGSGVRITGNAAGIADLIKTSRRKNVGMDVVSKLIGAHGRRTFTTGAGININRELLSLIAVANAANLVGPGAGEFVSTMADLATGANKAGLGFNMSAEREFARSLTGSDISGAGLSKMTVGFTSARAGAMGDMTAGFSDLAKGLAIVQASKGAKSIGDLRKNLSGMTSADQATFLSGLPPELQEGVASAFGLTPADIEAYKTRGTKEGEGTFFDRIMKSDRFDMNKASFALNEAEAARDARRIQYEEDSEQRKAADELIEVMDDLTVAFSDMLKRLSPWYLPRT